MLLIGGIFNAAGIAIMLLSMHWYAQQPWSISESPIPQPSTSNSANIASHNFLRLGASFSLLLLPLLVAFVAPLLRVNRRKAVVFAAVVLPCVLFGFLQHRHHTLSNWLAPFIGNWISKYGLLDDQAIMGTRPLVLSQSLCLISPWPPSLAWPAFWRRSSAARLHPRRTAAKATAISWRDLGLLLGPFTLAYMALLTSRASIGSIYDRYELPLMALLLVITRYYQEQVRPNLPVATLAMIALFGAFAIAATHDVFSMYRGSLAATEEIRVRGVPNTAIRGSFENSLWIQLEEVGHIDDPRARVPPGAHLGSTRLFPLFSPRGVRVRGLGNIFL